MVLTPAGLNVPAQSDAFDPVTDFVDLAASLEGGRIIVPVANATARNALATTWAPTVAKPLFVFRADAPVGEQLEYTVGGGTWYTVTAQATSGSWIGYTPVFQNLTVGNGTLSGRYRKIGRTVFYGGSIAWGTTTSATTTVIISLPAGIASSIVFGGVALAYDASAGLGYACVCSPWSGSTFSVTAGSGYAVSPSVPFTWTSGDSLSWQFFYETGS